MWPFACNAVSYDVWGCKGSGEGFVIGESRGSVSGFTLKLAGDMLGIKF